MMKKHVPIVLMILSIVFARLSSAQPCLDPPAGMVSWWPGDGIAEDIRGINNGVLVNGTIFAEGKVGQAFLLDGVDDHVQIPAAEGLAVTSVTVEAWIQPTVANQFQRVLINGSAYDLFIDDNARLRFIINPESFGFGTGVDVGFPGPVQAGEWTHIAGTYDELTGVGSIYINGVLRAAVDVQDLNPLISHGSTIFVGCAGVVSYFHGLLDELSVYDRALGAGEIHDIFSADSAGKCKPAAFVVEDEEPPPSFLLKQNFPNPFNASTMIPFEVPATESIALEVFNLLGENVVALVNEEVTPGNHMVKWDASGVPGGVYFCRLTTGRFFEVKRLILLK